MFDLNCIVVSPEEFDDFFRKDALIAEFDSESDKVEYERRDSFLIYPIDQAAKRTFMPEDIDTLCVGDDWWPNHTRFIHAAQNHCTLEFLSALRTLLTNEYAAYRIQICVYESLPAFDIYIGSMALYADRMVIESQLFHAFNHKKHA